MVFIRFRKYKLKINMCIPWPSSKTALHLNYKCLGINLYWFCGQKKRMLVLFLLSYSSKEHFVSLKLRLYVFMRIQLLDLFLERCPIGVYYLGNKLYLLTRTSLTFQKWKIRIKKKPYNLCFIKILIHCWIYPIHWSPAETYCRRSGSHNWAWEKQTTYHIKKLKIVILLFKCPLACDYWINSQNIDLIDRLWSI